MQMILPPSDMGGECRKAVAPIVAGGVVNFASPAAPSAPADGPGSAPVAISTIASGENAPNGGTISTKGCQRVLVEIDYLDGDDCDPCTSPDALTVTPVSFTMEADSTYEIPAGFWAEIRVTLVDMAGAPVDLTGTKTQKVVMHSGFNPGCAECLVIIP